MNEISFSSGPVFEGSEAPEWAAPEWARRSDYEGRDLTDKKTPFDSVQEVEDSSSSEDEYDDYDGDEEKREKGKDIEKDEYLLSSLPPSLPAHAESHKSLHEMLKRVAERPRPATVLDLIVDYSKVRKALPEEAKAGRSSDAALTDLMGRIERGIKTSYGGLRDFLGTSATQPALRSSGASREVITHRALRDFVYGFRLPVPVPVSHNGNNNTSRSLATPITATATATATMKMKPVVAVALPNGPLLAAACMAVMTYYTAAPINPAAGAEQFRADVEQARACVVLTTAADYETLGLGDGWAAARGITVCFAELAVRDAAVVVVKDVHGEPIVGRESESIPPPTPNSADDIALTLFTSGTSGTKKVVPLTTHALVAGVAFVVASWGLTPDDVCLNMMPLYHVGGLVRNILAPIFSGGSAICCPAFDPNLFWDMVGATDGDGATWYYASPSMHTLILEEATRRPDDVRRSRVRLVCNAAGGLLPSLAVQLRDTFHCIVLPSYGMTECMPISTPPVDYKLDRPGTSGISTGPELAILDGRGRLVSKPAQVGHICVRGEPVFGGYLKAGYGSNNNNNNNNNEIEIDRSPFDRNGWFDTGDMGHMDADGYLYITGRSKEVINRGGELISPFEVENAIVSAGLAPESPLYGRVTQALAFSVPHDVLQEVVGVVLVVPPGVPRPDLRTVHRAVRSSLQQAKWPALTVYMDDLPKRNNKVLRIRLGERLGLPEITDNTPYHQRHWFAACPAPDQELSVKISCSLCAIDVVAVAKKAAALAPEGFRSHIRENPAEGILQAYFAPDVKTTTTTTGRRTPDAGWTEWVRGEFEAVLPGYAVPQEIRLLAEPLPLDKSGDDNVDDEALQALVERSESLGALEKTVEGRVIRIFADVLARSPSLITPGVDFFAQGGDSLRAGRLLSALRSEFGVHMPVDLVFTKGSPLALAAHIRENLPDDASGNGGRGSGGKEDEYDTTPPVTLSKQYSSTNPFLMLLQLVPLCVLYPARRAFQWTTFMVALSAVNTWPIADSVPGRLAMLTICILFARVVTKGVAPVIGIALKWLIIGRLREGVYPMWGSYHTRWWLVQKITDVCGIGLFKTTKSTLRLYHTLMGARIGRDVTLKGATLGEWDLLDIGDGAVLERCTVRGFAAERNTAMYLGRVRIGCNASVGEASVVAAGTSVPDNTCIGPNSSSWELRDADESNRDLLASRVPAPHWAATLFGTGPLLLASWLVWLAPWVVGLLGLVQTEPLVTRSPLYDILMWFVSGHRIGYHYLALVLRSFFSPFLVFVFVVVVRRVLDLVCGKLGPSATATRSATETWRMALMRALMPTSRLHDVTERLGTHYETTSVLVRLLGGKVGRRVYWPGTGPGIDNYHLLDIGDDVVFGSRAHLVTSDARSAEPIVIGSRAMIADRVTVLPGVRVGHHTTLGSGALTRRGGHYPPNGTYVGVRGRDAVCLTVGQQPQVTTTTPHGEGDHRHDAQESGVVETRQGTAVGGVSNSSSSTTLAGGVQTPREKKTNSADNKYDEKGKEKEELSGANSPRSYPASVIGGGESEKSEGSGGGGVRHLGELSPFGRAFYLGEAPYHVWGPLIIFLYSSFTTVFTAVYWNVPNIAALQITERIFRLQSDGYNRTYWEDTPQLLFLTMGFMIVLYTAQAALAISIVVAAKWLLLGRRLPGNYDWDRSPYCQRWQLFLTIEKLRRASYHGHGVLGMLTGTHWAVLYFRLLGAQIGRDVALFADGRPSLMFTEPDLVRIGDRVVVDNASVVGHINTRGRFDLNRLEIGDRCVLRSGSRLLSGARMENDSVLLEHTLVMGGDVVAEGTTLQGWPAERFTGSRTPTIGRPGARYNGESVVLGADEGGLEAEMGV